MYQVIFSENALKQLKKIDKQIATMILKWIEKNLDNTNNPKAFGKSLSADKSGIWRYRIGAYRLLCKIDAQKILILVLDVGHRKNIYL